MTMTAEERILKTLSSANMDEDSIDKLINLAYYMGREHATKEVCDQASMIFTEQRARAENHRYHKLAMEIQGDIKYLYNSDYAGDMQEAFGKDITNL